MLALTPAKSPIAVPASMRIHLSWALGFLFAVTVAAKADDWDLCDEKILTLSTERGNALPKYSETVCQLRKLHFKRILGSKDVPKCDIIHIDRVQGGMTKLLEPLFDRGIISFVNGFERPIEEIVAKVEEAARGVKTCLIINIDHSVNYKFEPTIPLQIALNPLLKKFTYAVIYFTVTNEALTLKGINKVLLQPSLNVGILNSFTYRDFYVNFLLCPRTAKFSGVAFALERGFFVSHRAKMAVRNPFMLCEDRPTYRESVKVGSITAHPTHESPTALKLLEMIWRGKGRDLDVIWINRTGYEEYLNSGYPLDLFTGDKLYDFAGILSEDFYAGPVLLRTPLQVSTTIRPPVKQPKYDLVLRPFNGAAWICFACFLLICCAGFAAVHAFYVKFMPETRRAKVMTSKVDFLIVPFSAFAQRDPVRWFGKDAWGGSGMLAVWILGCLVVGKVHYGLLRGFFQSGWYDVYETPEPLSMKDLVEQRINFTCYELKCSQNYLDALNKTASAAGMGDFWQGQLTYASTTKLDAKNASLTNWIEVYDKGLNLLPDIIFDHYERIYATKNGETLLKQISGILSQMRDMHIPERTLRLPPRLKDIPDLPRPQPLNYEYFPFLSMILCVGFAVSIIACLWECCQGGFESRMIEAAEVVRKNEQARRRITNYQKERSIQLEKTFKNLVEEGDENQTEIF